MIFPTIQKLSTLSSPLSAIGNLSVCGVFSDYAVKFFGENLISTDSSVKPDASLTLSEDRSESMRYSPQGCRLTDEKYIISVKQKSNTEISVRFSSKRGLFRALNTLVKLIRNRELCECEIEDYPLFEKRGYIEGFYGKVWDEKSRRDVMKLMSAHGMNTYFYAAKDDPYHRARWQERYPEKQAEQLAGLCGYADSLMLDFYYSIAPGLTIQYSSDRDFSMLFEKIMSIYSLGVRNFALLLDDISLDFQYEDDRKQFPDISAAHVFLVNRLFSALREKDSSIRLTVCPTQYHGQGNEYYISSFGSGIPPEVDIFWTGRNICSQEITLTQALTFTCATSHRPLYWDNFPVNDAEMLNEMHLSPLRGRDAHLFSYCSGLIANVMEYPECSKIPLMTIAEYLWNPTAYDPEKSYNYALETILGEKKELFMLFADHLQYSCLDAENSVYMTEVLQKTEFLISTGKTAQAAEFFGDYCKRMNQCRDMLGDYSVPLFKELRQWSEKFSDCCDILNMLADVFSRKQVSKEMLKARLLRYNRDATVLTGFCLREAAEKVIINLNS